MEAKSKESESLKVRIGDVTKQRDELSYKFQKLKSVKNKEYDEKSDLVIILESTLENKNQEIEKLKKELEIMQVSEYICDICL